MSTADDTLQFSAMLSEFVGRTAGVEGVLLVSSDGMLVAASASLDRASTESVAATISGLLSLGRGAASALDGEALGTVVVEMRAGVMLVAPSSESSAIAVLAGSDSDLGIVTYEMARLVDRARSVLGPALLAELRQQVLLT